MTRHRKPPAGAGFTMLELMLVVAIMLLTLVLAVPSMLRSFRGARLRTSARTTVMMHRHARSLAVLQQKRAGLIFDIETGELEVVSLSASSGADQQNMFMEARAGRKPDDTPAPSAAESPPEAEGPAPAVVSELRHHLASQIRIQDFTYGKGGMEHDGVYLVQYYPNGTSDPYSLRLVDEKDRALLIKVDGLSGQATVKEE